jgi:ribonuclease HI
MQALGPHYLLFTDTVGRTCQEREWRFVLQPTGAGERITASDVEIDADGMRLDLLAVVRGLEALDGPSRVMLLAANRFVRRGIRRDLTQWREHGWRWERFGQLVPIRDLDLWQRVDRALSIHQVECFAWNAEEQEACTGRFSEQSARESKRFVGVSNGHIGGPIGVSRRGADRTYPQRRQGLPTGRRLSHWGHEVLDSLAGLGRTALSRTA